MVCIREKGKEGIEEEGNEGKEVKKNIGKGRVRRNLNKRRYTY